MQRDEILKKAFDFVKSHLSDDYTGHDFWHAKRVWILAKIISKDEVCDSFIIELAAILHDIEDRKFNGGNKESGGIIAENFLISLGVSKDISAQVKKTINSISFKGAMVKDELTTIESKIVQDADRLDAIGAIGIARVFACGNQLKQKLHSPDIQPVLHKSSDEYDKKISTSINHFYEKLLLIKDKLHTEKAKQIAERRHRFMKRFLQEFYFEWGFLENERS